MKRIALLTLALTGLASIASAYYPWTFFPNRNSGSGIPAKFDLGALPGNTVSYFISTNGPRTMATGDTLPAIVSEIRAAADVWNQVPTSSLRVNFGGFAAQPTSQTTPGIDVVFSDNIPPGLLAQTVQTFPSDLSFVANPATKFVPLQRPQVQLPSDLAASGLGPSYSEQFFTAVVHEFGHSLGLQHTLTSSVMSTNATIAATKAHPLAADDIAGISLLYPTAGTAATGSIQGQVSLAAVGINMANVVALSVNGTSVSTLTNPDGSFLLTGLPQGQYYVYVHPLPPPAPGESTPDGIVPPVDSQGIAIPAFTRFDTQFFPGTRDWTQASVLNVTPGQTLGGINFSMQPRGGPSVYGMTTYGYLGPASTAVSSPPLPVGYRGYMAFTAAGIASGGKMVPGLNVSAIGPSATTEGTTLAYYYFVQSSGKDFLYVVVDANQVAAATPVALAVTTPTDLYVLPAAFTVVPLPAPVVNSVSGTTDASGNITALVGGANLWTTTRVLFDGAPAVVQSAAPDGSAVTVMAPPGLGGANAVVTALGTDVQSSVQTLGKAAPVRFKYAPQSAPFLSVNPPAFQAGTDLMVEILGYNSTFVDGQIAVGFGSSDIAVRKVWVSNLGRLLMNVSVNATAQPGPVTVTVVSGLQLSTQTALVQVLPYTASIATLHAPVTNLATGLAGVPTGGIAVIPTSGLPTSLPGWTLTIGDVSASFSAGANQLRASVPSGASVGMAIVRLTDPSGNSLPPILMQIDPPPPIITSVVNVNGATVDTAHAAVAGDTIIAVVAGLMDPSTPFPASELKVTVGGVDQGVPTIQSTGQQGSTAVNFVLTAGTPAGPQPVVVSLNTRQSNALTMVIRSSDNNE